MEITLPAAYREEIVIAILTSAVVTVIWLNIAYYLLKWAIRNAIKESGLVDALRRQNTRESSRRMDHIPDIRAD